MKQLRKGETSVDSLDLFYVSIYVCFFADTAPKKYPLPSRRKFAAEKRIVETNDDMHRTSSL